MERYVISILGPTGIGKTAKSIQLAKTFSSEIISADSRQFFKEMKLGTAVPSEEELAEVKHWFIHHKSVMENYSVGDFEREALEKLQELFQKHKLLFLVGGSGLYMDAVIKGLDKFPKIPASIRLQLNTEYEENGLFPLQEKLKLMDLEFAKIVDLQNPQRVIRALEICIGTGKPYSSFLTRSSAKRNFASIKIGLTAPRELIYERINSRVDQMMRNGLLEEVNSLRKYRHLNALNTVGYKELFHYLDGDYSLEEAVGELKKNTRRFAKRQLTWFRKDPEITWFPYDAPLEEIVHFLEQKTVPR